MFSPLAEFILMRMPLSLLLEPGLTWEPAWEPLSLEVLRPKEPSLKSGLYQRFIERPCPEE